MMYRFYSEESRRTGCLNTAKAHREAAALFPQIRKVFESFDGKVYNCRLEKALQESTGRRIYTQKTGYTLSVYLYLPDYRGNSEYTIAVIKTAELVDGKRIPAAALIESARQHREEHLQQAALLESAPDTMPETAQRIRYFIDQANKLIDSLPYSVREMYGISPARMY